MTRVAAWLLLLSCTTTRTVTTFSVPRAPASWPSNVPSCVLDVHAWDSMCAPPLDITRDGVTIARPTYTTVHWSALPLLGTSTAHVQATASGLHVEGAAALARWVRASDVKRVDAIDRDWDTGCEVTDLMDTCGPSYVGRAATVHSSAGGPAIATIDAGTHVAPLDKRAGFTSIKLPNGEIVAPAGSSFWIADADLGGTCAGLSVSDGCPCP